MESNIREKVLAVVNTQVVANQSHEKAFGFYWTRKSAEMAAALIQALSSENGVILDPFLGSGSTALGTAQSGGNRLFIGIELNEMPIVNLRFSLGDSSGLVLDDFTRLQDDLADIRGLYRYTTRLGDFEVEKVIHQVNEQQLEPTAFIGRYNEEKQQTRIDETSAEFQAIAEQYKLRIKQLPDQEAPELDANSRIAIKEGMRVSDVFGPLGFESLSILRNRTDQSLLYKLVIASGLHLCRLTDAKSQSQFPFWFPKVDIHEKSVFQVLDKKFHELRQQLEKIDRNSGSSQISNFADWQENQKSAHYLILGNSAESMKKVIPDQSVDLVLTDPPYFDQVAYSEYLKLWEHFTGFQSDLNNEIVESSRIGGNKTREVFLLDLASAFGEVKRVMKPGAFALVYFKDSKPANLHDFIYCLESVGLKYVSQVHLAKNTYTYKQNSSQENTVGGDSIMIFEATSEACLEAPSTDHSIEALDEYFLEIFENYLQKHGPTTLTEALDNSLIENLYRRGYLSKIKNSSHFTKIASRRFTYEAVTRKWSI